MFWFHVTGMWYFYGQRRREEFKEALEGALKFFPGIKIKPEQELCFQSLVVKRKDVLGVWKSLIYQLLPKLCPSIGFTRPKQRREFQCFRYLSADLMLIWFFLDTDECSVSPSVCDTNANCSNTRGSYYCTCKAGFSGDGKNCQGRRKYFSW